MTVCFKCRRVLPGTFDPSEVVLCRECAEMLKSPMKVCGKCKHFIGGGDWNLCCDLMYDLCYARTKACDKYEEGEPT